MRSNRVLVLIAAGAAFTACKNSTTPNELGPPAKFVVVSGGGQTAPANTAIGSAIIVALQDANGHPLADKTVTMTVVAGGGSVSTSLATSDANGQVTLPDWTLGKSHSAQTVRFMSDTAHLEVNATVQSLFHIDVRFWGQAMTSSQQALFNAAAARIEGLITGDVQDALAQNIDLNSSCGVSGQPTMNETIDDIVIYASIQPIDGPNKILAQSGPCLIRDDPSGVMPPFPAVGVMEFDSADLETITQGGSLQDVITHEMMHVLGFGVIWDISPLQLLDSAGTANPRFTGPLATAACQALSGNSKCATSVPVEGTPAPAGTADSHWRESVFNNELMTGYYDPGTVNPISKITVEQFADLGYTVNAADFDQYLVPLMALRAPSPTRVALHDRVLQPAWALNPFTGHARRIGVR